MRKSKKNIYKNYNSRKLLKMKAQDQGVTMVALVVTIIILLILSGITIRFVVGDDGLIGQAKEAKLKYQNSALQEQLLLNSIEGQIASSSNGSNNNNSNNGSGTDNGNGSGGGNSDGNGEDNSDKMDELNKEIEELKRQIDLLKDYQTAGDAREEDVLAGKTFSCSAGIGLTGTMPNNGALNITLTPSGNNTTTKTIDEGYYSGGTITADGTKAYDAGYASGYSQGKKSGTPSNALTYFNFWSGNNSWVSKNGTFTATRSEHLVVVVGHSSGGNIRLSASTGTVSNVNWWSTGASAPLDNAIVWKISNLTVGSSVTIYYSSNGATGASWSGAIAIVL